MNLKIIKFFKRQNKKPAEKPEGWGSFFNTLITLKFKNKEKQE